MDNKELIKKVQSYFKKDINLIELLLVNYENVNYYIRIDKDKKKAICYLRSINLNIIDKFDKKYINQEVLLDQPVNTIVDILSKAQIHDIDTSKTDSKKDLVSFKAKIDDIEYKYTFNLFMPKNIPYLADVLYIIFSNLPKRLFPLFEEMSASLTNKEIKYLYKKPFKFDLFKGDYNKIYDKKTIELGEKQYNNQNVRYLELINETYYATIEDMEKKTLYSVLVTYNKKEHIVSQSCSCPKECFCEHMYAVNEAIRNKDLFNYYKVRLNRPDDDMYNKLFSLNYYLCLGIDQDKLAIVFPDGTIDAVPVLGIDHKSLFEVVEDDDEKNLTRLIKELENKKN